MNLRHPHRMLCTTVSALVMLAFAPAVVAQPAKEAPAAVTVDDPKIAVEVLTLKLEPLTKDELAVEADGWLGLLKSKVAEISDAEIAAKVEEDAEVKAKLLEVIPPLRDERTAIMDRFNAVLAALKEKGGETDEYEKYATAVSGINVDVKDVNAAWAAVTGWIKSPEGGVRWGINIALALVILIAFKIAAVILGHAVRKALSFTKNVSDLLRHFLENIVRKVTMVVGVVVALGVLELPIGPFVAAIGAIGFVVAFALQGTLSNFAAGVMILMYRPYDIGDFVEVAGVTGTVDSMSLVSTSIKTPDNQTVIVPNGSIWGGIIKNVTGNDTRRVDMTFGIGYGDDIAKAQDVIMGVLNDHPLVLKDPEPVVKLHELADSSVNFVCRPWSKTSDYWNVYWDVTRAVKERFDAEGISIPYPQQDVHMHQVTAGS